MHKYWISSRYYTIVESDRWCNIGEKVIKDLRNLFIIDYGLVILLKDYAFSISGWFVTHKWGYCPPERFVLFGAIFREICFQRLFSDRNYFIPHTPIFLPKFMSNFSKFISRHISGVNGFTKTGIHIRYRVTFHLFGFHGCMGVHYVC